MIHLQWWAKTHSTRQAVGRVMMQGAFGFLWASWTCKQTFKVSIHDPHEDTRFAAE